MSLYLKVRPVDWDEVIGQHAAVSKLKKKLEKDDLPHVVGIFGPTGTGKTTLARIVSDKLGCPPITSGSPVFSERNCADCRGIDDVRELADEMRYGFKGRRHVYILDEVVQLPTATQQAMLKMLEDTPKHVYFFLLANSTEKLLDTLLGRCWPVELKLLKDEHLKRIVANAVEAEEGEITDKVADKIVAQAAGSARMALQLLEGALTQEGEEAMLAVLEETAAETVGYNLAQAIFKRSGWKVVASILGNLGQDPEGVRRVVIKYAETVMLRNFDPGKSQLASIVITHLQYSLGESGRPGLSNACWRVVHAK